MASRLLALFSKSNYRIVMEWGGFLLGLAVAAAGLGLVLRAATFRNWLIRLYANPQMTRHLQMRGYVLSMRLVGAGWFVFGAFLAFGALQAR